MSQTGHGLFWKQCFIGTHMLISLYIVYDCFFKTITVAELSNYNRDLKYIYITWIFTESLSTPRLDIWDWPIRVELNCTMQTLSSRQKGDPESGLTGSISSNHHQPDLSTALYWSCSDPFFSMTHLVQPQLLPFFLVSLKLGQSKSIKCQSLMSPHTSNLILYLSSPS